MPRSAVPPLMSSTSVPAVGPFFAAGSPLAGELPGFVERAGQREMAELIAAAISSRRHVAIEAGAGTGKTLAYLIPALYSGRRVIVTTATRTLQDQLYLRDLPALGRALGRPARTAVLKGRANYLCRYRFEQARDYPAGIDAASRADLGRIADWATRTRSGDIAEVTGVAEGSSLWDRVTSTADNCLGSRCPAYDGCHVVAARKAAAEADLAVVNHHLLVADLTLRGDGFGSLLPGADVVIVDEAHRFPDIIAGLFDVDLSTRDVTGCLDEILHESAGAAPAGGELQVRLTGLADAAAALAAELPANAETVPFSQAPEAFLRGLDAFAEELRALESVVGDLREVSPGLGRCAERVAGLAHAAGQLADWQRTSDLCWVQAGGRGFSLHLTPLDATEQTHALLASQACTWVFTSATLAVDGNFSHFLDRLGLAEVDSHTIPSPYDFDARARLYLPKGMPAPDSRDYTRAVVEAARPVLEHTGGRAFLLFTSHRALREAAGWLHESLPDLHLLVQGSAPRSRLLEDFATRPRCVLLGTATFWEGVDMPGATLVVVAIDRLPFASPGDPYLQARLELIRRQGGDPFRDFQLPQAVLTLRQGVGRLIRGHGDYGVVILCDPRVATRSYGRVFLRSLPPMRVTHDLADVLAFLAERDAEGHG
jgi:ATP-dependent DNA helicase DinG